MDKNTEPETEIPVALMTSSRKAVTSKDWVPPRHSDSSLTTLGPQSVNTGRGSSGDNITVRSTLRCCVDRNLIQVSYHGYADKKLLPPCQSDMSHKRQHDSRKSPSKQRSKEVGYSIVEHVKIEFSICGSPDSI